MGVHRENAGPEAHGWVPDVRVSILRSDQCALVPSHAFLLKVCFFSKESDLYLEDEGNVVSFIPRKA